MYLSIPLIKGSGTKELLFVRTDECLSIRIGEVEDEGPDFLV